MKSKRMMTIAGLLVMAMVLTGCFTIRNWKWSQYLVEPGNKVMMTAKLKPVYQTSTETAYAVVLVGYKDLEGGTFDKFDTDANYGGPYEGVINVALENYMLSNCSALGVTVEDFEADSWTAFRSESEMTITGNDPMLFRHKAGPGAAEAATEGSLIMVSGSWDDDGDLIPEAFEVQCSGFVLAPLQIDQS